MTLLTFVLQFDTGSDILVFKSYGSRFVPNSNNFTIKFGKNLKHLKPNKNKAELEIFQNY